MIAKKSVLSSLALLMATTPMLHAEDVVLAKGPLVTVTRAQFEQALQRLDDLDRKQFLSKETRVFKAVQSYYITQAAIVEAKQQGIYDSPKMQALIEKAIGDTVLREMYSRYMAEQPPIDPEALARDYYQAHLTDYLSPEKISAAHILIDAKVRSQDEAKALAEKIRQEALSGKDFAKLADEYSNDPSVVKNHGDLGFFERNQMVAPFAEAAFALKAPDDISPVVETPFGFHIIKLQGRKAAEPVAFDKVKVDILKIIERDQEERYRTKFKNHLTDIEHTEINNEAIKALVTTFP
ncbi:MAG: hypothetical protein CVV13_14625 [Gammaproteobacteria bacterium HGW-Gammaproteobacteria-3]|nr:MAG: hypothetical protein CVV13_14625 [Gammaproteobacteria bacterium HGW-Gammaproteobacteria-3]